MYSTTGACAAYIAGAVNVAVARGTADVANGTAVSVGKANMSHHGVYKQTSIQRQYGMDRHVNGGNIERLEQDRRHALSIDLPVHGGHVQRLAQAPRNVDEQRCGRMITCLYGAVRSP